MNITLGAGSKCAVLLPQKFVNSQITPAKGLIINKTVDLKSLVLIEEVWQFKGLESAPLTEMCFPGGRIKEANWGWREVPELMSKVDEYLLIKVLPHETFPQTTSILEEMIKKSVADFLAIHLNRS